MLKLAIYYLAIPLLSIIVLWKLKKEKKYLYEIKHHLEYINQNKDKKEEGFLKGDRYKEDFIKSHDKIRKLEIIFVIGLLIMIPVWHVSVTSISHERAHVEIVGGGMGSGNIDPVIWQIKPTYDTDHALEKIHSKSDIYRPDLLNKVIDLENIDDFPGKIAVYRFEGRGNGKILLTYTYLSPIPVVKAVGIQWDEDTDFMFVQNKETFVFPMNPDEIARTADL